MPKPKPKPNPNQASLRKRGGGGGGGGGGSEAEGGSLHQRALRALCAYGVVSSIVGAAAVLRS